MDETVNALNTSQKHLRIMSTIFIIAAILCMILIFQNPPFATGMFVILMVFYFGFFKRQTKTYNQSVKAAVMKYGLGTYFQDASYEPKDGIDRELILQADFLPAEHPASIILRDSVKGSYQSMSSFITDITTDYSAAVIDSKGKEHRSTDYLSGVYYEIQLPGNHETAFILWPKSCMTEEARAHYFGGRHLCEILEETAWPGLQNYYILYGPDSGRVPALPDSFILAFKELAQFSPGHVAVQVSQNHMRIFIKDRFLYTVSLPIKMEITPKILSLTPFAEITYILKLADTLI